MNEIKAIAFYLPQFHPIPENDEWWGKGFTEWTNVAKAKPLFKGHFQPHLPADLGFYDLRVSEVREQQANLAKEYGISAFCYWHYWFGNRKRILERPLNEVIASGSPDFPFCLGWANETWSGRWHGSDKILIKQEYPGKEDYNDHFNEILPALTDFRYVKINDKNLFLIYKPSEIPDLNEFTGYWNQLAKDNNLPKFYFIGVCDDFEQFEGILDGYLPNIPKPFINGIPFKHNLLNRIKAKLGISYTPLKPERINYRSFVEHFEKYKFKNYEIPIILPNWDNTPRSGYNGFVIENSTPELFARVCKHAFEKLKSDQGDRLVFIKSWNEWAEGNYLEPDQEFGKKYLQVFQNELNNYINK